MEPKHTKLGIASLLLTSVAAMGSIGLIFVGAVLSRARGMDHDARQVLNVIFALCLCAIVSTNMIALGLGIAGLARADRKKVFAILGTVFASLQIIVTIIVIAANA